MKLRIAGLVDDSIVDGEGCRFAVFVQGCPHHCPNCQNPDTHPFGGGYELDTETIWQKIQSNPLLSGITLSGGEPFCQPKPLTELAQKAHKAGLNVWAYTGYTLEQLAELKNQDMDALLSEIDVLVDGPYLHEQRDLMLHFRGSRNQRVIDLRRFRQEGQIILLYADSVPNHELISID